VLDDARSEERRNVTPHFVEGRRRAASRAEIENSGEGRLV
jgi:hypothetical protein